MALGPSSNIRGLNVGVSDIQRWRRSDEVHLPTEKPTGPLFLPETRPLDAILKRETLDERLKSFLAPEAIDPDLLQPSVLTETRKSIAAKVALAADAGGQSVLDKGADLLDQEIDLDDAVREALAALLRG